MISTLIFVCVVGVGDGLCDPICPPGATLEGERCGTEINRGCFGEVEGGSNCCVEHGFPSCDNPRCVSIVCAVDSFCCTVAWDQVCVDEAFSVCPELCAGKFEQAWSPIALGQMICGSLSTSDVGSDDIDWYELQLDAQTEVILSLTGGPPMTLAIVDDDGVADCAFAQEWEPVINVAPCATASMTACLEAGTHWIVVKPNVSRGLVCGAPGTQYALEASSSSRACTLPDPINDACATALPIGLDATLVSLHDAATEDAGTVSCAGDEIDIFRDVWFKLDPPRHGRLRVSACHATFGVTYELAAYVGSCDALAPASCIDASALCPHEGPQLDVDVVAGVQLLLRVGTHDDEQTDSLTLTISYLPCSAAYDLTTLGFSPGVAQGISPDGRVVGKRTSPLPVRGFRWSEANGYQLMSPNDSDVFDVNSSGVAVGWLSPASPRLPGSASGLTLTAFAPFMGCASGEARALNESGVVVGFFDCGDLPVRWIGGQAELLPVPVGADEPVDINEAGDILGAGGTMAWLLVGDRFEWIAPPDARTLVKPRALNNVRQFVGSLDVNGTESIAFMWEAGAMRLIPPPAGFDDSYANDITDSGAILGEFRDEPFARMPFLMKHDVAVNLNARIDSREGQALGRAVAMNEAGVIVGRIGSDGAPAILKPIPPTGDLDCNAVVDAADLAELLGLWGPCPENTSCAPDFNVDGEVSAADLAILLGGWGPVQLR